jgi:hypothetical protein
VALRDLAQIQYRSFLELEQLLQVKAARRRDPDSCAA